MSEIEYQRKLLGDSVRNAAFQQALAQLIQPGVSTVADIGAGTGFLSFLARQLGARHCTLVEYSDTLLLAESLAAVNGMDGLDFVQEHSSDIAFAKPVDLVVSETLGNYALEENLLETLVDARRLLAPGGRILPCGLKQFVAPVTQPRLQQEIDSWAGIGFGLDYQPARELALNNLYVKNIGVEDLPGSASYRCWDELDFSPTAPAPSSQRGSTQNWAAELADCSIYGFALWWEVTLTPGITLSTAPGAPATHWEQVYLPLLQPLPVQAGDDLSLTLHSDTGSDVGMQVSWQTRLQRRDGSCLKLTQDMSRGRL